MNDDDFMKELEEVTKDLEKEYSKPVATTNTTNTNANTNFMQNNNTQQQMPKMDPSQMDFGSLFQNFDFGNDANNMDHLKKMFAEFDDGDPESKEMMNKISKK
jgi:hypothetical protein